MAIREGPKVPGGCDRPVAHSSCDHDEHLATTHDRTHQHRGARACWLCVEQFVPGDAQQHTRCHDANVVDADSGLDELDPIAVDPNLVDPNLVDPNVVDTGLGLDDHTGSDFGG